MEDVADVFKSVTKGTNQTEFKKPVVIGRRPGAKSSGRPSERVEQNQNNLQESAQEANAPKKISSIEKSLENVEPVINVPLKSATSTTTRNLNLNYVPPPSSSVCKLPYKLEVLKDGVIVQSEDLQNKKPFFVFGRLPSCDVVLQHPSISRYHAILQYKMDSDQNMGWHLFDLESTHGTYLNKQQIPPNVYCRVRSGHIFKMGVSSRLFILQGPEEDQEPISELSVSQLKELKLKRAESIEKLDNDHELEEQFSEKSGTSGSPSRSTGITWGMREDAEDENPLAENPFAMTDDLLNENLYLDDPKKSLRGWFEREGYELEYKVEEKNYAHFICRVELPIESPNGAPIVAEASVKGGKKKEAVVQCALEACRILDRHGVLRQSKHESKVRPRKRQFDDDYYSSDEDTFLDRTGTVERKRQARMKEKVGDFVETFESLSLKLQNITKEIADVQQLLNAKNVSTRKPTEIDTDDIDSYVKALQTEDSVNKKSAAALRLQLNQLQREETRLKTLVKIARPSITMVPPVKVPLISTISDKQTEEKSSTSVCERTEQEVDSTENPVDATEEKTSKNITTPLKSVQTPKTSDVRITDTQPLTFKQPKEKGLPEKTEAAFSRPADQSSAQGDSERVGLVIRKQKKRGINKSKTEFTGNTGGKNITTLDDTLDDDSKYAMWTPPEDQSGDGKTSLNRKYGY
nr:EOG090X026V [Simocephalus serrulatus]